MNIRLLSIALIAALLLPLGALAQVSEQEFWAEHRFLYQFNVTRQGGEIVAGYEQTTGDEPVGSGPWQLVVLGPHSQPVAWQSFNLADDMASILVRYQPNGTLAQVLDPQGSIVATINLAGSRVCDEDGACESQYGEVPNNCPADCGSAYVQAAIVPQTAVGKRVGAILMGLALAATGLLLLRGMSGLLDRRYRG
jgi:hypothetical protein